MRAPLPGGRNGSLSRPALEFVPLEAFLVSLGTVAIAEIGDKTQLLALILAVRFRAPLAVIAGIFVATIANHALAAFVGTLIAEWLTDAVLAWTVGISFLAMGVWALVPDAPPSEDEVAAPARYETLALVALGTTLGMMVANVPVVLFGEAAAKRVPAAAMRFAAAALFIVLGLAALGSAYAYAS